jgi:hypothetical protein
LPLDHHSLSPARLAANRANAQLSTGPKTPEGRADVSQNRWRHGLTGEFMTLAWEREEDFQQLVADLRAEHQPSTPTEKLLVDRMAQHYWLMQRSLSLQNLCFKSDLPLCRNERDLALYMRYQTTHERAFHKCLRELATLRAEKRKEAVGFESQKRLEAAEQRKQATEIRHQELHSARLNLLKMKIAAKNPGVLTPNVISAPALEHERAA